MNRYAVLVVATAVITITVACSGDGDGPSDGTPADAVATPTPAPASPITNVPAPIEGPMEIPAGTASAVTGPPADMTGINSMHDLLRTKDSSIRFGTQADPATVTLGPLDGGLPRYPPYEGKNSLNFKMPKMTLVLAPLDVRFVGFKNRSARYRQDSPKSPYQEPFDDLELCFESVSGDWPGLVLCVYHLYTTPLLRAHLESEACGIQEKWGGEVAEAGRIYYLRHSTERSRGDPESCQPLLGSVIERGGVIGYTGQVGNNPHAGFRFKVRSVDQNPLTTYGDPYLHWVQPSVFFYWQCFEPEAVFQPGVLAYPFDCGPNRPPLVTRSQRAFAVASPWDDRVWRVKEADCPLFDEAADYQIPREDQVPVVPHWAGLVAANPSWEFDYNMLVAVPANMPPSTAGANQRWKELGLSEHAN